MRHAAIAVLTCCLVAVLATAAPAEFTVLNTSDVARDEYLGVSIPFRPGQVADDAALSRLVIDGKSTAWRVLARYPDRSILFARAQARFALRPREKAVFRVVGGEAAAKPVPDEPADGIDLTLEWTDEKGRVRTVTPKKDRVLERAAFRLVTRYRGAIVDEAGKEALCITILHEQWARRKRGYLSVAVGLDSLHKPVPLIRYKQIALTTRRLRLAPLWPQKEGGLTVSTPEGGGTRVVLLRDDHLCDNAMKAYRFAWGEAGDDYVKVMAADPLYPVAAPATFKDREAAIGILGHVPPLPAGVTRRKAWEYVEATWRKKHESKKGPWDELGHACTRSPGATGDQIDFGVLAMFRTYQSGHPGLLANVLPAQYRESCRMNHFFGLDAKDLLPKKAVFWTEKVNERVWPAGLLGRGQKHWDAVYRAKIMRWWGYDEEHWSLNHLYECWTLTGDWYLHAELTNHYHTLALGWLNHFWLGGGLGNRALGRTTHAALLTARAVGDRWLIDGLIAKMHKHAAAKFEENRRDFAAHNVAAFAVWRNMRDGRVPNFVGGEIKVNDVVANWQEGLIGWAVAQLPDKRSRQMAYESGKNMCLNGFDAASGQIKDYYAAGDPSKFTASGMFTSWTYPTIRWAATEAARRKDPDAARMKQVADAMLARLRRGGLEGGVFARHQRWSAVP